MLSLFSSNVKMQLYFLLCFLFAFCLFVCFVLFVNMFLQLLLVMCHSSAWICSSSSLTVYLSHFLLCPNSCISTLCHIACNKKLSVYFFVVVLCFEKYPTIMLILVYCSQLANYCKNLSVIFHSFIHILLHFFNFEIILQLEIKQKNLFLL